MTQQSVTDMLKEVGLIMVNDTYKKGVLSSVVKSNFFRKHGGHYYLKPVNTNVLSDDNSFRVQIEVTNIRGEFICLVQKSVRLPEIINNLPSFHLIHKNTHPGRFGRLHETHQTVVKNSLDEVIEKSAESMVTTMLSLIRLSESTLLKD